MLGAEFATELLVGNSGRINKSQIYIMVIRFTVLNTGTHLAVQNKKQAITLERASFLAKSGKFAQTSYAGARFGKRHTN